MSKPRKIPYQLVERDGPEGEEIYGLLERLCERWHQELPFNRIAIAWAFSWKPNADGHLTLGKCKKASQLDRELMDFDFVILLNRGFWTEERVTDEMREALLDHELCHATIDLDNEGEPKIDTRGRVLYRTRKHDIEEFQQIVARHGVWKQDLRAFAAEILKAKKFPLLEEPPGEPANALAKDPAVMAAAKRFSDAMSQGGGGSVEAAIGGRKHVVKFPAKSKKKSPPRPRAGR